MANSEYQQRNKITLLMFPIIKDYSIFIGESDCSFLTLHFHLVFMIKGLYQIPMIVFLVVDCVLTEIYYAANVQACNCVIGDAVEASSSLWPSDTIYHFSTSSCWGQFAGRAKVTSI